MRAKPSCGLSFTKDWVACAYGMVSCRIGKITNQRTVWKATLCRYRSLFDKWLIHDRIKLRVNSIGMVSSLTRGRAFWKTWKPQYLRCGEDVEEKSASESRVSVGAREAVPTYRQQPLCKSPGKTFLGSGLSLAQGAFDRGEHPRQRSTGGAMNLKPLWNPLHQAQTPVLE